MEEHEDGIENRIGLASMTKAGWWQLKDFSVHPYLGE